MFFLCFLLVFGASGEELRLAEAKVKRGAKYFLSIGRRLIEKENMKEAFPFILKASDLGHTEAHAVVAEYYLKGFGGVPKNGKKAFDLLTRGEKAGDPLAFFLLGEIYRVGVHVAADQKKALKFYRKAMKYTKFFASYDMKFIKDTVKDLSDKTKEVKEMKAKAQSGDKEAEYKLAMLYLNGYATLIGDKDEAAFDWMESSSNKGYDLAQIQMGAFYYTGQFVKRDTRKAFALFEKAGDQGNGIGLINMIKMYTRAEKTFNGDGDITGEIHRLAVTIEESGDSDALYHLALMYLEESGFLKKNLVGRKYMSKGLYLLEKSVEMGNNPLAKEKLFELEDNIREAQSGDNGLTRFTCKEAFKIPSSNSVRIFGSSSGLKLVN